MPELMDAAAEQRLLEYFDRIGEVLGRPERRASFATYALGILGEGERKSIEPIAARACADPLRMDADHQRLHHFATDSPWQDDAVRREAARYALAAMTEREEIECWIIDDTGFPKQGKHSVGVQRQYSGTLGKVGNCQVAVSLSVATRTEHVPIDFALYLSESWLTDAKRAEARIPWNVQHATKGELALQMISRAVDDRVPPGLVVADQGYGSDEFRQGIRALGLHYAVPADPKSMVVTVGKDERRSESRIHLEQLARRIDKAGGFRRCTWREGTKEALWARFALRRVVWAGRSYPHTEIEDREPVWLLIEWRDGETEPRNYFFCSLPGPMTTKQLVRLVMQRWRTERVYEDLKGELGLDHYEGRRFPGWNHHVSVVLACNAFVVAERARRFPPSAGRTLADDTQQVAA
ncbi:MAG TPA: IS701 family transposase [Casimicrobiaceae bacterium]